MQMKARKLTYISSSAPYCLILLHELQVITNCSCSTTSSMRPVSPLLKYGIYNYQEKEKRNVGFTNMSFLHQTFPFLVNDNIKCSENFKAKSYSIWTIRTNFNFRIAVYIRECSRTHKTCGASYWLHMKHVVSSTYCF